ncbi:putative low-specificity L-threonine aldolase 1 [Capsicum annuum]|uniref:Low-specificity L-threonine aldolase 1 n=1 Tax=Capsicum annuum TaxID=4072 RepID=A0A2G2ZG07_CAPAN|nr:putative low-specificity L-threonine aldolase 1 [Capsicum annuum]
MILDRVVEHLLTYGANGGIFCFLVQRKMVIRKVDFQSDTVTKPTESMREAMANAEVDDDVLGYDPTAQRLEAKMARIMGKKAGLFVPSGTMGNLICFLTHCQIRESEVILGDNSHIHVYENGGISTNGGVHPRTVKNNEDCTMDLDLIEAAIRDSSFKILYPTTGLICLENSHARHAFSGRVTHLYYEPMLFKGASSGYINLVSSTGKMTTESQMMDATTSMGANNIATSSRTNAPPMMAPAEKPEKFSGIDFKRWQQKIFFYLTTLCLQRFTCEDAPEWNQNIKGTVGALERKYKMEDAGIKKFLVARFLDFKMIDSKSVVSQVQELQVIIHDLLAEDLIVNDAFQVAAIVEKLQPLWKDFKNYLKHKHKEITVEDLTVRLRIEEDNKVAERRSEGNSTRSTYCRRWPKQLEEKKER